MASVGAWVLPWPSGMQHDWLLHSAQRRTGYSYFICPVDLWSAQANGRLHNVRARKGATRQGKASILMGGGGTYPIASCVHPVPSTSCPFRPGVLPAFGTLMIFYCCRLSGPLYSWQHIVCVPHLIRRQPTCAATQLVASTNRLAKLVQFPISVPRRVVSTTITLLIIRAVISSTFN